MRNFREKTWEDTEMETERLPPAVTKVTLLYLLQTNTLTLCNAMEFIIV